MRHDKPKETLLELGFKLSLAGGGLLLIPVILDFHPVLAGFKTAMRFPGWVLLSVGLLVMALHLWGTTRAFPATASLPKASQRAARDQSTPAAYDQTAARHILKIDDRVESTLTPASPNAGMPSPAHKRLTHWSPEVFAAIEWRRFEAVVEQLFAQAGFETRAQSHGADGGVDVWLHSRHAGGAPVGVVQCKHWQDKAVPVSAMREFFGVMASHGLKRGTYATTSRFTADALTFARANGINAQDGDGLLALIAARTPEQQAALLATAFDGEY